MVYVNLLAAFCLPVPESIKGIKAAQKHSDLSANSTKTIETLMQQSGAGSEVLISPHRSISRLFLW